MSDNSDDDGPRYPPPVEIQPWENPRLVPGTPRARAWLRGFITAGGRVPGAAFQRLWGPDEAPDAEGRQTDYGRRQRTLRQVIEARAAGVLNRGEFEHAVRTLTEEAPVEHSQFDAMQREHHATMGAAAMCEHANEVPYTCTCQEGCYCKVRGTCVLRCGCGHWPSQHGVTPEGRRSCRAAACLCIDYRGRDTMGMPVVPPPRVNDTANNDPPKWRAGSEDLPEPLWRPTATSQATSGLWTVCARAGCAHQEGSHKPGRGGCTARRPDGQWCACDGWLWETDDQPKSDRAIRLREEE